MDKSITSLFHKGQRPAKKSYVSSNSPVILTNQRPVPKRTVQERCPQENNIDSQSLVGQHQLQAGQAKQGYFLLFMPSKYKEGVLGV